MTMMNDEGQISFIVTSVQALQGHVTTYTEEARNS